ncbi:MAG: hypothetical protein SH818_05530 [Saprospiraceae bacterium]|nr:hypothetical protein [Saprospiraceae bacterium]
MLKYTAVENCSRALYLCWWSMYHSYDDWVGEMEFKTFIVSHDASVKVRPLGVDMSLKGEYIETSGNFSFPSNQVIY